MSARVVRASGDVDERVARVVDRRVTTRTIEALAAGFGPPGSAHRSSTRRTSTLGPRRARREPKGYLRGVSFYDEVMRELVLGIGGALFVANAWALVRRRADAREAAGTAGGRSRGPAHGDDADLAVAPLARTVTYMLIGLIVAVWALASIVNS